MAVVEERAECRGHEPQRIELRFAAGAPVLWEDPGRRLALALRTVMTEPGTAPYMACLASSRATSPEAFRAGLAGWGAPTVNQVYADVEGRIAWQVAGFVPRRRGWRGLAPVPGDGRFVWEGFLSAVELPGEDDPARGFVLSANEMNLPEDWDHAAAPLGFEWHADGRAERIAEVLGAISRGGFSKIALITDSTDSRTPPPAAPARRGAPPPRQG